MGSGTHSSLAVGQDPTPNPNASGGLDTSAGGTQCAPAHAGHASNVCGSIDGPPVGLSSHTTSSTKASIAARMEPVWYSVRHVARGFSFPSDFSKTPERT